MCSKIYDFYVCLMRDDGQEDIVLCVAPEVNVVPALEHLMRPTIQHS